MRITRKSRLYLGQYVNEEEYANKGEEERFHADCHLDICTQRLESKDGRLEALWPTEILLALRVFQLSGTVMPPAALLCLDETRVPFMHVCTQSSQSNLPSASPPSVLLGRVSDFKGSGQFLHLYVPDTLMPRIGSAPHFVATHVLEFSTTEMRFFEKRTHTGWSHY